MKATISTCKKRRDGLRNSGGQQQNIEIIKMISNRENRENIKKTFKNS